MTTDSGGAARRKRLLWLVAVQTVVMAALGLLITRVVAAGGLLAPDDAFVRVLAAHRGPLADRMSGWLSVLADTPAVVGVTLLCVLGLLLLPPARRWSEALFLGGSVAVQSAVFLLVSTLVGRPRPDVPRLDGAPPTSSFPSGHVGASLALYGGLAVLALTRTRGRWRYLAAGILLLVPPAVGLSRMYRGMHHPSDVVAGLLNGTLTLLVIGSVFLAGRRDPGPAAEPGDVPDPVTAELEDVLDPVAAEPGEAPDPVTAEPGDVPGPGAAEPARPTGTAAAAGGRPGGGRAGGGRPGGGRPGGGRAVVVRHPHACPDELAARVRAALLRHGFTDQRWISTAPNRPCGDLAEEHAAGGADLVVACGGDGTVRACAEVVAGSGVPLVLVPCGTGNLLARNLGLPPDPEEALEAALDGGYSDIDTGRAWGDGLTPTLFTVMAGAGFDALMIRDASPALKARLGWPAYALAATRHLTEPRVRLTIRLDGGRRIRRRARMAVIGNVGTLQAGLRLLPRARPDSGHLELVLFDPQGPAGWLAAAAHIAGRPLRRTPAATDGPVAGGALEYFTATRIDVRFARPRARELDGETLPDGARLTAAVEPAALRVRLPRPPAATPPPPAFLRTTAPRRAGAATGPPADARAPVPLRAPRTADR
ncbi:diacylglycerol kinase family protein [Streptomyces roseolus]|uniref:diacylglycerol kinase family protein n=1 Tax=Streptomyces roseolus TaxID=67358 RepID=UPI003644CB32